MTVKELIVKLEEMPEGVQVMISTPREWMDYASQIEFVQPSKKHPENWFVLVS